MLHGFINGARQVLVLQLLIAIGAVALAGWTLGITSDLIRERERLRARVSQLEETLVTNDIVVPSNATVVATAAQRTRDAYPPSAPQAASTAAPAEESAFNPGQIIGDLFTPPPPMRIVVVHVRSDAEARILAAVVDGLRQSAEVRTLISVMAPRDQRAPGYAYFDGRQSSAAAALMQHFHDSARENEVAPWSAQLRGVALPAQGEYAIDRMDIVLPALSPAQVLRLDPAAAAPAAAEAPPPAPTNR